MHASAKAPRGVGSDPPLVLRHTEEVTAVSTTRGRGRTTALYWLVLMGVLALSGCATPDAPTVLDKTSDLPCTIEWTDNSDNEDGFNVYVGGSCADCAGATDWMQVGSVGKDEVTFTWQESCCSVAECSCATVRAFNAEGESGNSNIIMLAPVC